MLYAQVRSDSFEGALLLRGRQATFECFAPVGLCSWKSQHEMQAQISNLN